MTSHPPQTSTAMTLRLAAFAAALALLAGCDPVASASDPIAGDPIVDLYSRPAGDQEPVGLQMRVLDPARNAAAYVYGTFGADGLPDAPTLIVGDGGAADLGVVVLDGDGLPRLLYSTDHRTGARSEGVVELEPLSATSMIVKVYRYDWSVGAGRLLLASRLTQVGAEIEAEVLFADTLDAATPLRPEAPPGLADTPADGVGRVRLGRLEDEQARWARERLGPTRAALRGAAARGASGCSDLFTREEILAFVNSALARWRQIGAVALVGGAGIGLLLKYGALGTGVAVAGGAIVWPSVAIGLAIAAVLSSSCAEAAEEPNPVPPTRLPPVSLPTPAEIPFSGGTVAVGDNGNLADDAFAVFLDGARIGATAIGGSNSIGLGALLPGAHTLQIVAITAPDNVGTYGVSLGGGITFADGGTSQSGSLPTGGATSFALRVPVNAWAGGPA